MFQRNYTVKGADVNDFMVMQNASYLKYTSTIIETFLFVNKFTKLKMNSLKIGLQNNNDVLKQYKPLFFTQPFKVNLQFETIVFSSQKMKVSIHFYNQQNQLCATITRTLFWFDYSNWETIAPPKTIAKYFKVEDVLGRVC